MSIDAVGFQSKIKNRMANSVDTDEMAHYEPSHLDLHCLQRYLYWSSVTKGLTLALYKSYRPKQELWNLPDGEYL